MKCCCNICIHTDIVCGEMLFREHTVQPVIRHKRRMHAHTHTRPGGIPRQVKSGGVCVLLLSVLKHGNTASGAWERKWEGQMVQVCVCSRVCVCACVTLYALRWGCTLDSILLPPQLRICLLVLRPFLFPICRLVSPIFFVVSIFFPSHRLDGEHRAKSAERGSLPGLPWLRSPSVHSAGKDQQCKCVL